MELFKSFVNKESLKILQFMSFFTIASIANSQTANCFSSPKGEVTCEADQIGTCDNRTGSVITKCFDSSNKKGYDLAEYILATVLENEAAALSAKDLEKIIDQLKKGIIETHSGDINVFIPEFVKQRL